MKVFSPKDGKKHVGPTPSIYNTIKQKQEQNSARLASNKRGSINMDKVFKPQSSNTIMGHKNLALGGQPGINNPNARK